jgi:carbon-monoxide dehydrogenase large subunit
VQILSETLDIDPDKIVIVQGDSDIAQGIGSMGSRSLYIGGSAMLTASKQAIEKGRQLAGDALEAAGQDIEYRDGRFKVAGTDLGIGLFELAAKQPEKRIAISTCKRSMARRGPIAATYAKSRSIPIPASRRSCAIRPSTMSVA